MASAPAEVMVTLVPQATAPAAGLKLGVVWAALFLVTSTAYVLALLPVSVATTVIVFGVARRESDRAGFAGPTATVVPSTVIVPLPVGVTVTLETAFATVTPP